MKRPKKHVNERSKYMDVLSKAFKDDSNFEAPRKKQKEAKAQPAVQNAPTQPVSDAKTHDMLNRILGEEKSSSQSNSTNTSLLKQILNSINEHKELTKKFVDALRKY